MKDGDLINTPIEDVSSDVFEDNHPDAMNYFPWRDVRFDMTSEGLFYEGKNGVVRVSDRFWCDSRTREFDASSHGVKIGWLDDDCARHITNVTFKEMASVSKLIARLTDQGLRIEHGAEKLFVQALKAIKSTRSSRVVSRIGWHADQAFVLPTRTIGACEEQVSLAADVIRENPFAEHGTLDDWKAGPASMAIGNSRLMFAISVALSGPLLDPGKAENTTFHVHGSSSIGKTSAARLAATVWGAPRFVDGFMKTWKTTSNGFEPTAKSRCDTCLIMDEINMADPKEVAATAYQLSSGTGKTRMTSDLTLAPTAKWRIAALSTGEYSFQQYLGTRGVKVTGGQSVRFASLPADAGKQMGILEDIHGVSSPSQFIAELHAACDRAYGTAGPEFVKQITWFADRCAAAAHAHVSRFVRDNLPEGADGQVQRVCTMFGRVASASAIASNVDIVPWTADQGTAAVATCFKAWLSERGHVGSHEVTQGIRVLRDAILRREPGEIGLWGTDRDNAKLGFRRLSPAEMAGFYLHPWAVKDILKDHDVTAVFAELKRQGQVTTDQGRNYRLVRHPVTGRPTRFLCILPSFLEDADDAVERPDTPDAGT